MRAREILQEDYTQNLESDLNNILIGAKGAGASQLSTEDLVFQLQNMGYSVSPYSLTTLLRQNPNVLNATTEMIQLKGPEDTMDPGASNGEDSADQVADMARKATKIG